MRCHQVAKVPGRVAGEGGFREMRVLRQETRGFRFEIGEIAAATAGDANLLARLFRMIDDAHAASAPRCPRSAEQAGRAGPNDQDVYVFQIRSQAVNRGEKVLFPPCWRLAKPV